MINLTIGLGIGLYFGLGFFFVFIKDFQIGIGGGDNNTPFLMKWLLWPIYVLS